MCRQHGAGQRRRRSDDARRAVLRILQWWHFSVSDDGVLLGRALRGELLCSSVILPVVLVRVTPMVEALRLRMLVKSKPWLARRCLPADSCATVAPSTALTFQPCLPIGETWGEGDRTTTFNIPDLRGRTAIGAGKGAAGGYAECCCGASGAFTAQAGRLRRVGAFQLCETYSSIYSGDIGQSPV